MPWHARLHRCCKPRIIKLPVYIYHPSHVNEPMKILNIICFSYFLRNYKVHTYKHSRGAPLKDARHAAPKPGFVYYLDGLVCAGSREARLRPQERQRYLRWRPARGCSTGLLQFQGLRERLLVDNLFLAKLVMECVVEPSAMSVLF
uniref:Uncharacterized protein n=1 Tax=Triticum urartu TaxID=4572 RepID=A0A8R7P4W9_TRIUA